MDGEIQKDTHRYTITKNHVGSYVRHTNLGNFSIAFSIGTLYSSSRQIMIFNGFGPEQQKSSSIEPRKSAARNLRI